MDNLLAIIFPRGIQKSDDIGFYVRIAFITFCFWQLCRKSNAVFYVNLLINLRNLTNFPYFFYVVIWPQEAFILIPHCIIRCAVSYLSKRLYGSTLDNFGELIYLVFYLITRSIYLKAESEISTVLYFAVAYLVGSILILWFVQLAILYLYEDQVVMVLHSGTSSADSAHLRAKIGENTWEIFKTGGRINARIIPHTDKYEQRYWHDKLHVWIPFANYGVLGTSTKSTQEIDKIFEEVYSKYNSQYSSSYHSCQEIALAVANKASADDINLNLTTNSIKSTFFGIIYVPILCLRIKSINIEYR